MPFNYISIVFPFCSFYGRNEKHNRDGGFAQLAYVLAAINITVVEMKIEDEKEEEESKSTELAKKRKYKNLNKRKSVSLIVLCYFFYSILIDSDTKKASTHKRNKYNT